MMEAEPGKAGVSFRLRLAERNICVTALYPRVFLMCQSYLGTFDEPDFAVATTDADIGYERTESARAYAPEKKPVNPYSDDYLETLAVYRQIAGNMLDYDTLLFHGAAVAVEDRCFLFMAKSGVGKTTHIKNWLKIIPGAFVVNGDKPLINTEKRLVYGTPWCGKEGMNTNTAVPLAGLIALERDTANTIEQIPFADMLPCLLTQCYRPEGNDGLLRVLHLLGQLHSVPCYRLRCNMEETSALVSYNGMHQ